MKKRYIYLIFFLFSNMIFIQTKSDPVYELGKDIFLNQLRPDISRVMTAVTNGIGVMPAYESQLNANEIKAVSYYVSISSEKD